MYLNTVFNTFVRNILLLYTQLLTLTCVGILQHSELYFYTLFDYLCSSKLLGQPNEDIFFMQKGKTYYKNAVTK